MQKIRQKFKKHKETIHKISKINILEYKLEHHHWLMIIGGSFTIAFFILISYLSTVLAYEAYDNIGQSVNNTPVFTTVFQNNCFPNNAGLNNPQATEVDAISHRLFVADHDNDRVLVYNLDENNNLLDHYADNVLGQDSLNDYELNQVSQTRMNGPGGLILDQASSTLYVSDELNNRVLVFDVSTITDGQPAINVLGQNNFTTSIFFPYTSSSLTGPLGLALDFSVKKLYVADYRRVLVFDVNDITNGEPAINVLGQADFTSQSPGTSQTQLRKVSYLVLDQNSHRLFTSDIENSRILVFDVNEITNGEPAINVLGQANFTSRVINQNIYNISATEVHQPQGLEVANNNLFVADFAAYRVLIFDITEITNNEPAIKVLGQSDPAFYSAPDVNQISPYTIKFDTTNNKIYVSDYANSRVVIFEGSEIISGEEPIDVLGHLDSEGNPLFDKDYKNNCPPNANGFNTPGATVIDTYNHRLFVSDFGNNRILVFDLDENDNLLDQVADYVLGQDNFSVASGQGGEATDLSIGQLESVTYLFVADRLKSRVLIYNIDSLPSNIEPSFVLGQPDFSSIWESLSQNGLSFPSSIYFDNDSKKLFVSDGGNSRLIIYDFSNGITSGQAAEHVLGQPDFDTNNPGLDDHTLGLFVQDIVYESSTQKLFVADYDNNRVIVYDLADGITDGESAYRVLGQVDFDSSDYLINSNHLSTPLGLSFGFGTSTLFVSDGSNRIMVFDISSIENGESAIAVVGQDNFISQSLSNINNSSFGPSSLTFNQRNNRLYVSDDNRNRIMIFDFVRVVDSLPAVILGENYNQVVVDNFQGSLTSQIISGSLPPGLTLDGARITGTPTTLGNYTFKIRAVDNLGNAGYLQDEKELNIEVTENLSDWSYRKKITIDHDQFLIDSENYPILVSTTVDINLAAKALSNGNDLLFAVSNVEWAEGNTSNKLDYQIESYNSETGALKAWVNIPSLSASQDTEFYLYYGNDSVLSGLGTTVIPGETPNNPEDFYSIGVEQTFSGQNLSNWVYRKKILLHNDSFVGNNLKDFPVLVKLNVDQNLVEHALVNANDILFMTGSEDWVSGNTNNRYAYKIESYNSTTGELSAWVKIPNLSTTGENYFYLYYGNNGAVSLADDQVLIDNANVSWIENKNNIEINPVDFYTVSPELSLNPVALSSWLYRKEITVDGISTPDVTLNDYPVHLDLLVDSDLSAKAQENGLDILFVPETAVWSAGTTNDRYQYRIISYTSSTGALEAYVNLPNFGNNDLKFYIYYGRPTQESSLEDHNTQNGSSLTTQASGQWQEVLNNNNNPEIEFYTLGQEEFYNQNLYHLNITGQERMVVDGSQLITLTLKNEVNETGSVFSGYKNVVFSGARASNNNVQPTCTNYNNEDKYFGQNTVINFVNGIGNCVLKLHYVENAHLDAAIGELNTNGSVFYGLNIEVTNGGSNNYSQAFGTKGNFIIGDGSTIVSSRYIKLYLDAGLGVNTMAVANDKDFVGIDIENFQSQRDWLLSVGDGLKTVYLKYWYSDGSFSGLLSQQILLDTKPKIIYPLESEKIKDTPFVIKGIANPNNKVEVSVGGTVYGIKTDENGNFEITVLDQLISDEYLIKAWQLDKGGEKGEEISRKIIVQNSELVEPVTSTESIVEIEKEENIINVIDKQNVVDNKNEIVSNKFKLVNIDSPTVEKMEKNIKQVKNKEAFLLVMKNNSVNYYKEQINGINTVPGEKVQILLRPKTKTHSVVGKLYQLGQIDKLSLKDKIRNLLIGKAEASNDFENKKLVGAYVFDYDEQYNIYRTDIKTTELDNLKYELEISINNEDGTRLEMSKKIQTNYSGTISTIDDIIPFARLEIFKYNVEKDLYEKWPGELYGGVNPAFSNKTGQYAIQLPAGTYYLNIDAVGYKSFQSKVFVLEEPQIINEDFVLEEVPYSWWIRFWDWLKIVIKK